MHQLKLEGGVPVCEGNNLFGQCDIPSGLAGGTVAVKVAAGSWHSVAVGSDGTVWCWGRNVEGQCDTPEDLGAVSHVAAGPYCTFAAGVDGRIHAWGELDDLFTLPDDFARAVSLEGWLDFAARMWGRVHEDVFPKHVRSTDEFAAIRAMHRLAEE